MFEKFEIFGGGDDLILKAMVFFSNRLYIWNQHTLFRVWYNYGTRAMTTEYNPLISRITGINTEITQDNKG